MRRMMLLAVAVLVVGVAVAAAGSAGGGEVQASSSALPSGEIVFTRDASSLYVMSPDGSNVRVLLDDASNAAVSKDGRQIAFVRAGAIWVMQRDGSGQRQLTHPPKVEPSGNPTSGDYDPAWSPDGRVVYFSRVTAYANASIFSVHADGSGLRRLTRAPTDTGQSGDLGTCHEQLAPSPDGRLVVYIAVAWCSHGGQASIKAITGAGRPAKLPFAPPRPYGDFDYQYSSPAWAPAGDSLAYAVFTEAFISGHDVRLSTALNLAGTDGSKPQRIVLWRVRDYAKASIRGIAWSTDGRWLVFTRYEVGMWLVRRDGTGLRRIAHTATDDSDPAWLPSAR